MSANALARNARRLRRVSLRALYTNAAIWGFGNGLVSSSLVVYLAGHYGARGFAISLILAAPRLIGVLRLAAPVLMEWVGNRQRFAVHTFLASAAALVLLLVLSTPGLLPVSAALTAVVACWTLYHFFEFLGTIALWSWIGDLLPRRVRGRFVGKRGGLMNAGQVIGMILGAACTALWQRHSPERIWLAYAVCVGAGAVLFAAATWPLMRIPNLVLAKPPATADLRQAAPRWGEILLPFRDRAFRRYLLYGGWFSFANGLPGTSQFMFQMRVLEIGYGTRLAMDGTSQGVQSFLMPWIGSVIDRRGNVPVLVASQLLVALSMAFFIVATPEYWWLVGGAYLLWIAYAGINVALPNLMLTLTRQESYAAYAAAWFAWTQLVYALSTLAGGLLFEWASTERSLHAADFGGIDHFAALFVLGLVLRMIAVGLAARVPEPTKSRDG
jgi:MFS family permease